MTEMKILKLSLENFKNHKALTLDLDGRNASVYGKNGVGKTSIYDALLWLLFDKDSAGNGGKNLEIKPLDGDGAVRDHDALTSVEAVLMVSGGADIGRTEAPDRAGYFDGACIGRAGSPAPTGGVHGRAEAPAPTGVAEGVTVVTLKRTYREVWTTKRGSSQATYDGNTSEYFVDGVPMKKNGFQEAVRSLVDEDSFVMLTSLDYFPARMDWKKRREALFRLAGIEDDRMILGTDERFLPLLEAMGRSDLDGLKRKLAADKKALSVSKNELPARLSECEGLVASLGSLDFEGARLRAFDLRNECDRLSGQIAGLHHSGEMHVLQARLKEAEVEKGRIVAENELYRKNQLSGSVDVPALNARVMAIEGRLRQKQSASDTEIKHIRLMDARVDECRRQWMQVNGEIYRGDDRCPTCGQTLPAMQMQVARDAWAEQKQTRLDAILREADGAKANKAAAEARHSALQEEIRELETEASELRQQIADANASRVEPKDMEGFGDALFLAEKRINELNEQLFEMRNNAAGVKQSLEAELQACRDKLRAEEAILSKEAVLKYTEERIDTLRADARKAAEALDGVESLLFLCEEYSRYKTTFVEDSINGMFRLAKFRLFREQANGGIEDRCDVVYNGIPYCNGLNDGMKVNVGIDIINTLSLAYGVRVPLFVDNAERVTDLEYCNSQRIRLVVSEMDKELRVDYEN